MGIVAGMLVQNTLKHLLDFGTVSMGQATCVQIIVYSLLVLSPKMQFCLMCQGSWLAAPTRAVLHHQ